MNILGLSGIDQQSADVLLKTINQMTDASKTAVIQKLSDVGNGMDNTILATSRSNYISRLNSIDPVVADAIMRNQDQLCDAEIYSVVALGDTATSITDLFTPDGAKVVGLRNIANQKLDAGKWFLVKAIEFLYGIDASHSGYIATFGEEQIPADFFNGEFELTQNGRKLISKQSLAGWFTGFSASRITSGTASDILNVRAVKVLENPKFILPQEELKGRLEWGHACGAASSYVKIRLIGTVNERA